MLLPNPLHRRSIMPLMRGMLLFCEIINENSVSSLSCFNILMPLPYCAASLKKGLPKFFAAPTMDEFERQCAEAVKLEVPENKLEPLRKQYRDAVRNRDNVKAAKCLAELQELMKSAASAGLNRFR